MGCLKVMRYCSFYFVSMFSSMFLMLCLQFSFFFYLRDVACIVCVLQTFDFIFNSNTQLVRRGTNTCRLYKYSKRSVGWPNARWTDELVKTAGSRWIQVALDPLRCKLIGRPMFSSGQQQADMMMMS